MARKFNRMSEDPRLLLIKGQKNNEYDNKYDKFASIPFPH